MLHNLFLGTNDISFNSGLSNENTKNNNNTFRHYSSLMKKNVPYNDFYTRTLSNIHNNPNTVRYTNTETNYSNNNFCTCSNYNNTSNQINQNMLNIQKKTKKNIQISLNFII
jgi:hypothetical protein